ncbi:MAG: TetR/AcrR family transcriptional regulator [Ardenticatenales bacterium]|nr:TetR/AcrR family transcriptional regulator [Ardenticatenales bacterium]
MNTKRSYHSNVRDKTKSATRRQILQAVAKLLEGGIAEVTVPAVARTAALSISTVYRHFPSKQAMIDALPAYLAEQLGLGIKALPTTPDELATMVQALYADMEAKESLLRGALLSEFASDLRQAARPQRLQMIDSLLPATLALDEADRARLRNTLLVLSSSAVIRAYKDYLDLTWEEAAENAAWAIRTLARATLLPPEEP